MKLGRRGLLLGAIGAGGAAALTSCADSRVIGFDPAKRSLDIANGGEPLSLDPHKASGTWENNIIGNLFVGLTSENERAEPGPGMATHWDTSEDGLTWTFYLREAYWSDGEPVNSHDFVFAFQRILNPLNLCEYAPLLYPILNAEAVNKGDGVNPSPYSVGVSALDDRTLEIKLEHPAPYLLQLLKHYTAYPVPKHAILRHGNDWIKPENIVVNGPFKLEKWWSNYIIHIQKNPAFYDSRNVWLEDVYFYPSNDSNAAARSVLSGERGWSTNFPSGRTAELRRTAPSYVRVSPYLVVTYFSFNMQRRPFGDARVRRALTMAIDRDFIATKIYKSGEKPALSFVPPGIANYGTDARYPWAGESMEARRAEARRLLTSAGFGPNNPLRFEFSHRNGGDNPRVAVVVQADWRGIAPWVICELRGVETQIHYANLRAKNYQIGDGGWVADFNDARNYLYLLETRTGAQNYSGFSNPEFDALMHKSDFEPDAAARARLMMRAEQIALDEAALCTTIFGVARNLVDPRLTGWEPNLEDIHRARWLREAAAT
ncbi:MAG: peptide ABC transporter substrate-binding protein [Caulobacterales bacterium]